MFIFLQIFFSIFFDFFHKQKISRFSNSECFLLFGFWIILCFDFIISCHDITYLKNYTHTHARTYNTCSNENILHVVKTKQIKTWIYRFGTSSNTIGVLGMIVEIRGHPWLQQMYGPSNWRGRQCLFGFMVCHCKIRRLKCSNVLLNFMINHTLTRQLLLLNQGISQEESNDVVICSTTLTGQYTQLSGSFLSQCSFESSSITSDTPVAFFDISLRSQSQSGILLFQSVWFLQFFVPFHLNIVSVCTYCFNS